MVRGANMEFIWMWLTGEMIREREGSRGKII